VLVVAHTFPQARSAGELTIGKSHPQLAEAAGKMSEVSVE
jgi:hypothetical protein